MIKKIILSNPETHLSQKTVSSKIYFTIFSLVLVMSIFMAACKKDNSAAEMRSPLVAVANDLTEITANSVLGPGKIDLRTSKDFSILTETGITTTGVTKINGNIGTSPIASTAITGFGLIMNSDNQSSHTPIVTGKVYAANYATPTPAKMTEAVKDMRTAFTAGNGLVKSPIVNLYAGNVSGKTLKPGLYKWSTGLLITDVGVTLSGGAHDTWVFQIAKNLTVNNNCKITLAGGAQAKNVYWVVSGKATLGTYADFSGIILSKTLISLNTGAKVTGKLLAQTAVTLIANTLVKTY